jgi:phosphoribosylanthranilate isomerase
MLDLKIKICGMKDSHNCKRLLNYKVDYLGFIFYDQSPRFLDIESWKAFQEVEFLKSKKVGVFVDADIETLVAYNQILPLDVIQLHGSETAENCQEIAKNLNVKIWKAFQIAEQDDLNFILNAIEKYSQVAEALIFDTKSQSKGGSGKSFDWNLLKDYQAKLPFLLSGGIGLDNLDSALEFAKSHPSCIGLDLNSKLEISPGIKSEEKVAELFERIN